MTLAVRMLNNITSSCILRCELMILPMRILNNISSSCILRCELMTLPMRMLDNVSFTCILKHKNYLLKCSNVLHWMTLHKWVLDLKKVLMSMNSIIMAINGRDTLKPRCIWFRPFANSEHDTKCCTINVVVQQNFHDRGKIKGKFASSLWPQCCVPTYTIATG
jgi:hypothetical protein